MDFDRKSLPVSRLGIGALAAGLFAASGANAGWGQQPMVFTCGKAAAQQIQISSRTRYAADLGVGAGNAFGFDLVASPEIFDKGACESDKPFFFSVRVPEGNYEVQITLGSGAKSSTSVRAESRRLVVPPKSLAAGESETVVFNVNVRTKNIAGASQPEEKVRLKPREVGALDWDEKLTLEFNGDHPAIRSLKIRPLKGVPTVYLAGDSTVVDQDKEPWAAWGQMLPAFFGTGAVIANEAESGETIRSFTGERRLAKILSTIQAGDWLMIQFGHNDQKLGTPEATDFKGNLRRYVDAVRKVGASPVLVTSMNRRTFDTKGKITDSLGGYPQAMREFAEEAKVPLIDLNADSKTMFEAMRPVGTLKAFVHFPANTFPDQAEELKDDTHFTAYGAYELARAVVQEIRDRKLPLKAFLRNDIPKFDPRRPDPVSSFVWPPSPWVSMEKPYGK